MTYTTTAHSLTTKPPNIRNDHLKQVINLVWQSKQSLALGLVTNAEPKPCVCLCVRAQARAHLVSHFRHFRKKSKNRLKKGGRKSCFSIKNDPWAQQGRLIHSLCLIFEVSKNHCFFDADLGRLKIHKKAD